MSALLKLVLALVFVGAALTARAQSFPPGTFSINGIPVACGAGVWTVVTPGIGDIGRAMPASHGNPATILLDPVSFNSQPLPVKFFVYAHECGHHMVGYNEAAADCWATKLGRAQGWFNMTTMQFLVQSFQWNPGDWTHAPGPQRLANIWSCFTTP